MSSFRQFVLGLGLWTLAVGLCLVVADRFALDLFVMLVFIGLLIVAEVSRPVGTTPQWLVWVRWVIRGSAVVFISLIVLNNVNPFAYLVLQSPFS